MVTCKLTSYYSCKDKRPYCAMPRKMLKVELHLRNAVDAQLGVGWGAGGRARPFFENRKMCPDFGKKTLILPIFDLNFLFKV